jgi:putative NADH-flavin reductase
MKLALFGATGLTGGLVLAQALEQGHEVVALVREPGRLSLHHPRLTVLAGSPIAPADVERCIVGADVGEGRGHCDGEAWRRADRVHVERRRGR